MEPQDYNGHTPTDVAVAEPVTRQDVTVMTNRELAEETVTLLRQFSDGLAQFSEAAHHNPVMKNLLGL